MQWQGRSRIVASLMVTGLASAMLASGGVVPTSAGAQDDGNDTQASEGEVVDEFFVVQADDGTLVKHGDKFTLTLKDVDSDAVTFSDRPSQSSGAIPVAQMVKNWEKLGFDDDPPNAALSVIDGEGRGAASTFELSDPKREKSTITFTATPLENLDADVAPAIQEHVAGATGTVPKHFGTSTLFIDPSATGPIQSCTAEVTNKTGTVVVGAVAAVLPTNPVAVIPPDQAGVSKTSNLIGCTLGIVFTTGARTWHVSLSAVTGKRNTFTAGPNVSAIPGNYNSPNWVVRFTLN